MNERIKFLRKKLGLTQDDFAKKIGIKQSGLSAIEKGVRGVTDRNIRTICDKFGISEKWLRTGEGEPFDSPLEKDVLASYCGDILLGKSPLLESCILELMQLSKEDQEMIGDWIINLADKLKQRKKT